MTKPTTSLRPIRSFVLRQGRITPAQRTALDILWQEYVLDEAAPTLDLNTVFGRAAPCILEIGFGMGDTLAETALAHPEQDYLGIEVHRPGVGNLLKLLAAHKLTNVRVICADAIDVLTKQISDASLDAVHLFFPDPWPKRRHHKRRIVQTSFANLVAKKLKPGGCFQMATDWEEYAQHMLQVVSLAAEFTNTAGAGNFAARSLSRPLTKFERRGQRLGYPIRDLVFVIRPIG